MADVCLVSFVLHEAPPEGRAAVLDNALRLATEEVIVVDIAADKVPSAWMLVGEPYLPDYLARIEAEMEERGAEREVVVPGRVTRWRIASRRESGPRSLAPAASSPRSEGGGP